ncbi:MAG TPA: glucose 1-dehydrogenase [Acidimicrobiales bacterium]|nr:glucose 1-dehydrogenase [Acidimicrobiales bacterium]
MPDGAGPGGRPPAAGRLAGRVALVTGAGQGLGAAFAGRLADEGAAVVVADLDGARAAAVAADLGGDRAVAVQVDVADPASVDRMAREAAVAWGTVDVLVNNASVFSTLAMRPFEEIPVDEWDRVMAVNVRGTFLCTRAVVPGMRRLGRGKIVNISSATVFIGRVHYLHYVTSKAAVVGMTRALAKELGADGITVNAVTPGSVDTGIVRPSVTDAQVQAIIDGQAVKRRQVPADVVGTVAFLASPDSDFITGQTVNVDGGAAFH